MLKEFLSENQTFSSAKDVSFFLSCRILIFVFSNSFSKIFKWNLRLCHLLFLKFLQKISCMMQIKIPLFLPVNDENSFNQNFFLVRRQSGRVKRHAYSYVFLLRPPLPKARSRGGRQFLSFGWSFWLQMPLTFFHAFVDHFVDMKNNLRHQRYLTHVKSGPYDALNAS